MLPLMAILGLASMAQQAMHKDPAQLMTPTAHGPGPLPQTPLTSMYGNPGQQVTPLLDMLRSDPSAPGGTSAQPATDAGPQLLNLLQQSRKPAAAPKGYNPEAPTDQNAASDQRLAEIDARNVPFNAAPGAGGNDVEQSTTGIGKLKADNSQTFMGLSGQEWGSIGQAAGVLANLMKPLPPRGVLTPGSRGIGSIPFSPVGSELASPGAQRLGNASQFAINSPDANSASILRALRGQGSY